MSQGVSEAISEGRRRWIAYRRSIGYNVPCEDTSPSAAAAHHQESAQAATPFIACPGGTEKPAAQPANHEPSSALTPSSAAETTATFQQDALQSTGPQVTVTPASDSSQTLSALLNVADGIIGQLNCFADAFERIQTTHVQLQEDVKRLLQQQPAGNINGSAASGAGDPVCTIPETNPAYLTSGSNAPATPPVMTPAPTSPLLEDFGEHDPSSFNEDRERQCGVCHDECPEQGMYVMEVCGHFPFCEACVVGLKGDGHPEMKCPACNTVNQDTLKLIVEP